MFELVTPLVEPLLLSCDARSAGVLDVVADVEMHALVTEGYLVADAHSVYDHIYGDNAITEVGCWAHARRYFFKALSSDPERAKHALSLMKGLFRIERDLATAPRKKLLIDTPENPAAA